MLFSFCAWFPASSAYSTYSLARGSQGHYLYEGVLVRTWNGHPTAVPWSTVHEVARRRVTAKELEMIRSQPSLEWVGLDHVQAYYLKPIRRRGLRIDVPDANDPGDSNFCRHLERLAVQGGALVVG